MKYNVAIIGGGPAGYTAAEKAAAQGLSVVLFEKNALGGVCLNEGCVPTKTLLYSAKVYDTLKHASKYGISTDAFSFDMDKIIARKNKIVKKLTGGIKLKMKEHHVEVIQGEACIRGCAADGTITSQQRRQRPGRQLRATGLRNVEDRRQADAEAEARQQAEMRAAHQASAIPKKRRGPADNLDPDIEL